MALKSISAGIPIEWFFGSLTLRENVMDCSALRDTLGRIEAISAHDIQTIIEGVPDAWMAGSIRAALSDFLVERAQDLRNLFTPALALFPRMAGVTL